MSDLDARMAFLLEADRLRCVERANVLTDGSRPENAAEHSWHLALAVLTLPTEGVEVDRALAMALVHDLVEIDAGDHPIHLPAPGQAAAEARAAERLFALAPDGDALRALWQAFEDGADPTARHLRRLDHLLAVLQVGWNAAPPAEHAAIARDNLATGRAAALRADWPDAHAHATALLDGRVPACSPLTDRFALLSEADRLKTVIRATLLGDGSRFENSAEHSWHLALAALVLAPYAPAGADPARVARMLVLHDLIEIDAGDSPFFGTRPDQAEAETRAADRLFGLLPGDEGAALRALWDEFEDDETPDARFAKSLDRFQAPVLNLANGGGSWVDYDVSEDMVRSRVGPRIARGAPRLWAWLSPRIAAHFAA